MKDSSESHREVVRVLRAFGVYLLSMGLLLCLIPALTIRIGHSPDSVSKLRKLNSGPANPIVTGLIISLGIFSVALSRCSLWNVGKVHIQEVSGVSLARSIFSLVTTGLFRYAGNLIVFAYFMTLAVVGRAWRSMGAALVTFLLGGILIACWVKVFG